MTYWKRLNDGASAALDILVMIQLEEMLKIRQKIQDGTSIIVEGKNDKKALEGIGFCNVIAISGRNYEDLLEELGDKKIRAVAILTDFDKEGEKKHRQLRRIFERFGIKVEPTIRRRFKGAASVNKIEELRLSIGEETGQSCNQAFLAKELSTKKFLVKQQSKKKHQPAG